MTRPIDRRTVLRHVAYGLAAAPFVSLLGCGRAPRDQAAALVPEPGSPFGLAAGLSATVLDTAESLLSDGFVSPSRPDGMGCFVGKDGRWILMRNHEIDQKHIGDDDGIGAYDLASVPPEAYSTDSLGAVTRLVVDPATLTVVESNLVLSGTRKNCAGGLTPMGWLSCEETLDDDGGHGFVYLCDAEATGIQPARRIEQYGRFLHEAAGFDGATGICYLTEDHDRSCLYRFLPVRADRPFDGRLQALAVSGQGVFATTTMRLGDSVQVKWIDVPDPLAGMDVAPQCQELGAAIFVRGEGCWFDEDRLVFAATEGGVAGNGQIFELRDGPETGIMTVLAEATESLDMVNPDNITIAPDGSVYFAEDHDGECLIQRISADGIIEPLARSAYDGHEIAGLCFSPDGQVLFANIQDPGITVAITGL